MKFEINKKYCTFAAQFITIILIGYFSYCQSDDVGIYIWKGKVTNLGKKQWENQQSYSSRWPRLDLAH